MIWDVAVAQQLEQQLQQRRQELEAQVAAAASHEPDSCLAQAQAASEAFVLCMAKAQLRDVDILLRLVHLAPTLEEARSLLHECDRLYAATPAAKRVRARRLRRRIARLCAS